jgi:hypothetical protein
MIGPSTKNTIKNLRNMATFENNPPYQIAEASDAV